MVELENIVRDKRAKYISLFRVAQELKQTKNCEYYEKWIFKFDEILKILS